MNDVQLRKKLDELKAGEWNPVSPDTPYEKSALEMFQGMIAGELPPPPIGQSMDFLMSEAEEGHVVFVGWPAAAHLNPMGTVHGGWAATIMDSALACAVHSTCPAGRASTTVEMKLNYLRPIVPDSGMYRCEATIVQAGRTLGIAEARLTGPDGKLYAFGTETCMIFDLPSRND
ncbi:PaaI family thioesterase [Notoacmeibacter ruber]|uniref:PaaI family thioesterase n=1 Tax=Notoacmeibacter ruber TaxID=2670375 RepID=A0A3L7JA71_9HYPH|nr:PaaI family thioesterase [Notoacmeibacter ruber]RLQ87593.1 PaaI family thioesterase [Notoacmeibacter ruber]